MSHQSMNGKHAMSALPHAFTRGRLAPLNELKTIHDLLEKLLLDDVVGASTAAFAAPISQPRGRQFTSLQVAVFSSSQLLVSDRDAKANAEAAETGRLLLSHESLLACAANYLFNPESVNRRVRDQLANFITTGSDPEPVYKIENLDRFRALGAFSNSSGVAPNYHIILPFCVDDRLVAVVGMDLAAYPDRVERHVRQVRAILQDVVRKIFYTYHVALASSHAQVEPKRHVGQHYDTYGLLVTRRYYDVIMQREALTSWAFPSAVCLIMYFDGNGVKAINDSCSHLTGDTVIAHYAGAICKGVDYLLETEVAHRGFVVRWGGDEFISVLALNQVPDDSEFVARAAARLRAHVAETLERTTDGLTFTPANGAGKQRKLNGMIGISSGWSTTDTREVTPDAKSSVEEAEKAMYICKRLLHMLKERSSAFPLTPVVGTLDSTAIRGFETEILRWLGVISEATPAGESTEILSPQLGGS